MFSQNSRIIPNSYLFSIDTNPFFFLTVLYNASKSNIKVVFSNVLNIRLCNDFGVEFNRILSIFVVLFLKRNES